MMKLLNQYNKIVKQIYDYFDCDCDSDKRLPIDDFTEFYYKIVNDRIYYSNNFSKRPNEYTDEYITSYEGDDFIMFHVKDTSEEGSLSIFDKTKLINNVDDYSE